MHAIAREESKILQITLCLLLSILNKEKSTDYQAGGVGAGGVRTKGSILSRSQGTHPGSGWQFEGSVYTLAGHALPPVEKGGTRGRME